MTPNTDHHKKDHESTTGFQDANAPSGLTDQNAEIFSHEGDLKATFQGQTKLFNELPKIIQAYFSNLFDKANKLNPECIKMLKDHFQCKSYEDQVKQFVLCNYGGFDNKPDYHEKGDPQKEYWNCGLRGKCKAELCVCRPDCIVNNNLSLREVDIIKCIASGKTDQETADYLNITLHTARTHEQNIRRKLNINHRTEIAIFGLTNHITF